MPKRLFVPPHGVVLQLVVFGFVPTRHLGRVGHMRVQWSGGGTRTIKIQLAQRHPLWLGRKLEARKPNLKNWARTWKTRTLIRVPTHGTEISTGSSSIGPRYPKYPNNPKWFVFSSMIWFVCFKTMFINCDMWSVNCHGLDVWSVS